jgi:hypothetical protein
VKNERRGLERHFCKGGSVPRNLFLQNRKLDSSTVHSPECVASILHIDVYAQSLCGVVSVPFARVTKQLFVDNAGCSFAMRVLSILDAFQAAMLVS